MLPKSLSSQFMRLGYHVYVLSTQSPDVDATKPILYATVLVLLALTFTAQHRGGRRARAHATAALGVADMTAATATEQAAQAGRRAISTVSYGAKKAVGPVEPRHRRRSTSPR